MALKLAERVVDAIVTCLQTNLATELTAIDTDRGDGLTLTAPASGQYYKRPKSEVAGATAHVEVYEEAWEFEHPYTDADAGRAVYDMPVLVRLTFFNRAGESADTMMTRMRRYQTGLLAVFNQNPRLADTDDAIKNVAVITAEPYWEFEGEDVDKVRCVSVAVRLVAKCEETYA